MIKSYKVRLFPTEKQEKELWKHIHSCRFLWNFMLAYQNERYADCGKHLSRFEMIRLVKIIKQTTEFGWLQNVSAKALTAICSDLAESFNRFFKGLSKHPTFKAKKTAKAIFPARSDGLYFIDNTVNIEKIGKIELKSNFVLPQGRKHKFINARISYVNGKWILGFAMECESQTLELTDKPLGIDLGIKELAAVEFNNQQIAFSNINKSKRIRTLTKKLKHIQRAISRKQEVWNKLHPLQKWQDINSILKYKKIAKEIHYRLHNIRHNYIHQITHYLISLKPKVVGMENLNIVGMMKNKHLSKAITEQCFYEFIRQMKYKCKWAGITFIQVPRFYPSSKICSCCGNVKRDLKLSDRVYKCSKCGTVIDRDYNAAKNLANYAKAQLELA